MRELVLALGLAALLAAPAAGAGHVALSDLEDEIMCPTCGTALSLSESPVAQRIRALVQRLIDRGRSEEQIKAQLVEEFGPEILALPPRSGFSLAAYVVPPAALLLALLGAALALRRRRPLVADPAPPRTFDELVDADLTRVR